jgi:hypothetical protein
MMWIWGWCVVLFLRSFRDLERRIRVLEPCEKRAGLQPHEWEDLDQVHPLLAPWNALRCTKCGVPLLKRRVSEVSP